MSLHARSPVRFLFPCHKLRTLLQIRNDILTKAYRLPRSRPDVQSQHPGAGNFTQGPGGGIGFGQGPQPGPGSGPGQRTLQYK